MYEPVVALLFISLIVFVWVLFSPVMWIWNSNKPTNITNVVKVSVPQSSSYSDRHLDAVTTTQMETVRLLAEMQRTQTLLTYTMTGAMRSSNRVIDADGYEILRPLPSSREPYLELPQTGSNQVSGSPFLLPDGSRTEEMGRRRFLELLMEDDEE